MKLKRNSSYLDLLPTYFMFGFAIERAGVGGTAGGRVCGEGEGEGEGDGIVFLVTLPHRPSASLYGRSNGKCLGEEVVVREA